jgi:phytoene/squalene synthetase
MKKLYDNVSERLAKSITRKYSTSFSLGILCLDKKMQQPIYNIYGFVRLADEIVDSFHDYDKLLLLNEFEAETYLAIERKISTNPVLNAFQKTYHEYGLEKECIDAFLKSMRMDLDKNTYSKEEYENYILGSAEVVGLMCLKVFVEGKDSVYQKLKPMAMSLGAAFQKINFLRDLQADYEGMGRQYFPNVDLNNFNETQKQTLLKEIEADFDEGYKGIVQLPKNARFGVYLAYMFYRQLLGKIKKTEHQHILQNRIRISNRRKYWLLTSSYLKHSFNLL